jgi:RNA polymerase sigma-70 factor (ECF subfamily)
LAIADEQFLIQRASRGDASAFETLVTTYEKGVYNLAFRLVGDREDAMDITQDVFLKAYQALPRFRGDSRFSTWIYRVCVNASLDHLRKKQKQPSYSLDEPLAIKESSVTREVADESENVEDSVEIKFLSTDILRALRDLDPAHRAIILLCDVQGYSYQEIADILGLSMGTVKSRLHRARNMVRRVLPAEHFATSSVKGDERRDLR